MPTEKCKAREVMALGKYTFNHTMVMITVCAFCMHSWLNVIMLAFTAEFSAGLYSTIILFFFQDCPKRKVSLLFWHDVFRHI